MTFFAVFLATISIVLVYAEGQPLDVTDPAVIASTLQTVEAQKKEIGLVGEFWSSLAVDFLQEGISQTAEECQEKLGEKCTSGILQKVADCINSSAVIGDVKTALNDFITPLLNELKAIEEALNDPSTDKTTINKDVWTMNLTRTDSDSFAYRKNKAQSEFIMEVNPITSSIPNIGTQCLTSINV